jgi:hypothetical protein
VAALRPAILAQDRRIRPSGLHQRQQRARYAAAAAGVRTRAKPLSFVEDRQDDAADEAPPSLGTRAAVFVTGYPIQGPATVPDHNGHTCASLETVNPDTGAGLG